MAEAIHILLIDDSIADSAFVQAFKTRARDFEMKITHVERGKNGLNELKANPFKYRAVILDAKCIWDESGEFPSDKFLGRMVTELERLERELNIYFPTVVNTAYIEDFKEEQELLVNRGGKIFLKSTDNQTEEAKIFNFLRDKVLNSEGWKYRDVLRTFDKGYLDKTLRVDLLNILKKLNDTADVKNNLTPIRKILEAIYRQQQLFIPTITALFPAHISSCAKAVKDLSSTTSHLNAGNVTIYCYKSAIFALLETLVWFHNFMEKP